MKQTAIQQAIAMVRSRMESMDETLMGKHTIHNLQQIERLLYELLNEEKDQIKEAYKDGSRDLEIQYSDVGEINSEEYYNETYGKDA
jgi:hypothetical protein